MTHTLEYTLATHLMTATPRPPKPPTQTEQFIDAPPKDVHKHEWLPTRKPKQENKHDTKHTTHVH